MRWGARQRHAARQRRKIEGEGERQVKGHRLRGGQGEGDRHWLGEGRDSSGEGAMRKEGDTGARGVDSWEETNIDGERGEGRPEGPIIELSPASGGRVKSTKLKANEKLSMEGEKDHTSATRAMLRSSNSVPALFFSVSASHPDATQAEGGPFSLGAKFSFPLGNGGAARSAATTASSSLEPSVLSTFPSVRHSTRESKRRRVEDCWYWIASLGRRTGAKPGKDHLIQGKWMRNQRERAGRKAGAIEKRRIMRFEQAHSQEISFRTASSRRVAKREIGSELSSQ
ncbi:hypothetical protein B0H14DRAFT_2601919 [Mycena olivaceomarginata]|nr:hypothetical protein B0H14DRAFT_2601919 [Mycena olivaceomarginata]